MSLPLPEEQIPDEDAGDDGNEVGEQPAVNGVPGPFHPHRSEGSFSTMTRLPIDSCETFAAWMLKDFEHGGETVCLAPGEGFYVTEGLGVDEVRIAFMYDAASLTRAMAILASAVAAYPGKRRSAAAGT